VPSVGVVNFLTRAPIAAFLFLPDVKFAMLPLVLFIISIVNRDFSQNVKKRKDLGTRWNVLLIKNVQGK
jgi:hypothetical protein